MPAHLLARGAPNPKPKRDAEHVWGKPNLSPRDHARTESANVIYRLCCRVLNFCSAHDILWTCENPTNSWFWALPP
eukprot:12758284-Heterocapsa_arctica.AAC.1